MSNGGFSILQNHLSEVETHKVENLSEDSDELAKDQVVYDFNDEGVGKTILIVCVHPFAFPSNGAKVSVMDSFFLFVFP